MATKPQAPEPTPDLTEQIVPADLTVKMAAQYCPALGERYIRQLVDERRIPIRKPDGKIFIKRDDLESYLNSGLIQPVGARYSAVAPD